MLEFAEKHLALTASIIVSAGTILATHRKLWKIITSAAFLFRGPFVIRNMLIEMDRAVKEIRYQVQTNDGGSLKDAVLRTEKGMARLDSFRQHEFRYAQKPGFELDGDAQVISASEASCRLFRVADTDELTRLSWLRFLDVTRVAEFLKVFRETAATGSFFSFSIKLRAGREDRGEWEFKATPIDTEGAKLYMGYFSPLDAVAKEIASRANWLV